MSKHKRNAWKRHQSRFEKSRDYLQFKPQHPIPWGSSQFWKKRAILAAEMEQVVFSRPALRWDRHRDMSLRRRVRSEVKKTWNRYLKLGYV